jgi:hypothetical protein
MTSNALLRPAGQVLVMYTKRQLDRILGSSLSINRITPIPPTIDPPVWLLGTHNETSLLEVFQTVSDQAL